MELTTFEIFLAEKRLSLEKYSYQARRQEIHTMFPYVVVLEGTYPEFDYICQYCRRAFGDEYERKWQTFWLGKTGYDYGFKEYCFKNGVDRKVFLNFCSTFDYDDFDDYDTNLDHPYRV